MTHYFGAHTIDAGGIHMAARRDGVLAGFLMARADHGDFGRTEPVAVLDTIGVDPAQTRQGVARALLTQIFANLTALRDPGDAR